METDKLATEDDPFGKKEAAKTREVRAPGEPLGN